MEFSLFGPFSVSSFSYTSLTRHSDDDGFAWSMIEMCTYVLEGDTTSLLDTINVINQ